MDTPDTTRRPTLHIDLHLTADTAIETRPIAADVHPFATLDILGTGDDRVHLFVHDEATVDLLADAVERLRDALRIAKAGQGTESMVA